MLSKVPSLIAAGKSYQPRLGAVVSQRLAAQVRQYAEGGKVWGAKGTGEVRQRGLSQGYMCRRLLAVLSAESSQAVAARCPERPHATV
jgi:hypothetical protein